MNDSKHCLGKIRSRGIFPASLHPPDVISLVSVEAKSKPVVISLFRNIYLTPLPLELIINTLLYLSSLRRSGSVFGHRLILVRVRCFYDHHLSCSALL